MRKKQIFKFLAYSIFKSKSNIGKSSKNYNFWAKNLGAMTKIFITFEPVDRFSKSIRLNALKFCQKLIKINS